MSYIKNILHEEHRRLQALCRKYMNKIDLLPKGTISIKKRKEREYLYLANRQGEKVRFTYIGSVTSEKARKLIEEINDRKNYQFKLNQVKKNIKEIGKALDGRKI